MHKSEAASTNTIKNLHAARLNGQLFVFILLDLLTLNPKSIWMSAEWILLFSYKQNGDIKYLKNTCPLLGIYLEKTIIQKDTCTPLFIAVLFYNSQDMETI